GHVVPGEEMLTGRGEDDDPNFRVCVRAPPRVVEVFEDAWCLGVRGLRAVQGDHCHRSVGLVPNEMLCCHCLLLLPDASDHALLSERRHERPGLGVDGAGAEAAAAGQALAADVYAQPLGHIEWLMEPDGMADDTGLQPDVRILLPPAGDRLEQ